jgi:hypothetical protein
VPILFIIALVSLPLIARSSNPTLDGFGFEPATIPPSMTLLAGGARWAAQNGNSTLFIDWEDDYLAHGKTDGINWGPWPTEENMENWTLSIAYMLNQTGLDVRFAGDMPDNLTGYDLLVIHAYWAVEPRHVAMVRDFIANGGGVVILSGVPEFFRCYCKDWWTYICPTDNASLDMKEYFGCDGNYVNTGGYANVTVDNPFNAALLTGDTLIEGAPESNAAVLDPHEGSQVIAEWERGCAFAFTYEYGQGRVYYQAAFVPLDPPSYLSSDINHDGTVSLADLVILANAYGSHKGDTNWSPDADINGDGAVGLSDLVVLAEQYTR